MATLSVLLDQPGIDLSTVAKHLDALSKGTRIAECRELEPPRLAKLYEVAGSGEPLTVDELLGGAGLDETVRFAGRNSLPAFTAFEKHFARHGGEVVGINVGATSIATGPGYFTCGEVAGKPKELLFDYTKVPETAPPGWPRPVPNAGLRIARFVYGGMHDHNRRVTRDVIIGSATRHGRPIHQFYVLSRE